MKSSFAIPGLIVGVVQIAGCVRHAETTVAEHDPDAAEQQKQKEEQMHKDHIHHHQHAFADPEKLAQKWNTAERDRLQRPDEIVAALALSTGATVADVGAGTGYMVAHLSQAVGKGGTVIAIDAEPAMIEYLEKHAAQWGPGRIVSQQVEMNDPQLQAASVDGVLTLDVWHHMQGREFYAKKIYEGLKRGGRFVIVDYNVDAEVGPPREMRLSPEQATKELLPAGFRVEVSQESMPHHYMIIGHKD